MNLELLPFEHLFLHLSALGAASLLANGYG
jgi:hypothetical protein